MERLVIKTDQYKDKIYITDTVLVIDPVTTPSFFFEVVLILKVDMR